MNYRKYTNRSLQNLVSIPFIWLPLPFLIMLDIVGSVYQEVCFPLYGLEKVKHSDYILIRDRAKLDYLTTVEKFNCMYCGYGNGVLLYLKEIAGRTEKYWCGIKHQNKPGFVARPDQIAADYAEFGDEKDLKDKYGEHHGY